MYKVIVLAIIISASVFLVKVSLAQDHKEHNQMMSMDEHKAEDREARLGDKGVDVDNKICPVSREKIVADTGMAPVTYEYKGKIYYLCCQGCVSEFEADPEKYSKIADDEAAKEKINNTSMGDMSMDDMPMDSAKGITNKQ